MANKDPDNLDALRHIEGFPIGEDEDLLAISDPPYYTAYPNPHITELTCIAAGLRHFALHSIEAVKLVTEPPLLAAPAKMK